MTEKPTSSTLAIVTVQSPDADPMAGRRKNGVVMLSFGVASAAIDTRDNPNLPTIKQIDAICDAIGIEVSDVLKLVWEGVPETVPEYVSRIEDDVEKLAGMLGRRSAGHPIGELNPPEIVDRLHHYIAMLRKQVM